MSSNKLFHIKCNTINKSVKKTMYDLCKIFIYLQRLY